ncbi:toprim domain-containing protein [Chitinophaga sp. MM2321]|uniref:toprim domain-containing protein n=1 Tax=Chitinophaga sp. MM2321 TaxID=3137178 RepID=UPI0032D59B8F
MENISEKFNCNWANQFDLVDYLSALGHEPKKTVGNNYWYLSPLREEKTPSFKVNRKLNVWSDFGDDQIPAGKKVAGGDLVAFGTRYHHCTVSDFLTLLKDKQGMPMFPISVLTPVLNKEKESAKIIVVKDIPLAHPALLGYLRQRRIPLEIANTYCKEVHYLNHDQPYFSIGFKNDAGGFELRNAHFKGCSSPKHFTHLRGPEQSTEVCVFEGFFSFLSYLTLVPPADRERKDMLILNSLSFFESARTIMETYPAVNLYLDQNTQGIKKTAYARSLDPKRYRDNSEVYKGYDDFNHLLCNSKKLNTNRIKLSS